MSFVLLLTFSLATPFGVIIGLILSGISQMIEIIFMSLAAGSFTYIACSEVIVEEFEHCHHRWPKMGMFLLGVAFITLLTIFVPS